MKEDFKDIEIIAGDSGRCLTSQDSQGLIFEDGTALLFSDIAEIFVHELDMVHGPTPKPSKAMALSALAGGRPGWPVTSRAWAGDVMEVTFVMRTHDGREYLAKADNDAFTRLKDAYLAEPEE